MPLPRKTMYASVEERLVHMLYCGVVWLIQPLVRFRLRGRAQAEPLYGVLMEERFGVYTLPRPQGFLVWIHAVSLGETRTAAILVTALRKKYPDMRLLFTHGTATGREQGKNIVRPGDIQVWQPWDTPAATRAFVSHYQPDLALIMETEIWPNLIFQTDWADVPIVLINGRVSPSTFQLAKRHRTLCVFTLRRFTLFLLQTRLDVQCLEYFGLKVEPEVGNMKFDVVLPQAMIADACQWLERWHAAFARRHLPQLPIVLFASSREGEEEEFLQLLQQLHMDEQQAVQWLVVPRHPQRFEEVADLIASSGFECSRRLNWMHELPLPDVAGRTTIWLGNSIGEMPRYYTLASVALLGGSFQPLGGQNLIESLACGCPVIVGPHYFNFREPTDLAKEAKVAVGVNGLHEAVQLALSLCGDPVALKSLRHSAMHFVSVHRGATQKTVETLETLLITRGQRANC